MIDDWQSWAAGAIVLITMIIFILRLIRKKPGCGGGCDCDRKD